MGRSHNYLKKIILLLLGMICLSIGIVLNTKSHLGVGSITTVPYVFSEIVPITLGQAITLLYFIFVIVQTLLIKRLDIKIILQFPFSFLFGYCTDFFDFIITINPQALFYQIMILIIATLLTALGVYFMIKGNIILNPSDGIVQTIANVSEKPFGKVKMTFDISMVILALMMCIIGLGEVRGIGIGTISNALCIGSCVAMYDKILKIKED